MPLINFEINLIVNWFVDSSTTGATKFPITDTKRYVLVVTLLERWLETSSTIKIRF